MNSKNRVLTLMLLLTLVQTSLKLISDSENLLKDSTTSKKSFKRPKLTKTVKGTRSARKLQFGNQDNSRPVNQPGQPQTRTPNNQTGNRRRRQRRGNARRRIDGGVPRFASDREILDIHRRSLVAAFGDPRAPNVRQRPGTECDFYAEFEPFHYTTLTRTASTTIHFSSNCMRRTTINVETVFGRNRLLNWNYHPTRLFLNIFGNVYEVRYSQPRVIDRHDMMRSLRYTRGVLLNSFRTPFNLNLPRQNSVYLAPQVAGSFNNFNMRRFQSLRGHWRCRMRPRRFSDYNGRIRRRRVVIERLRERGFSNREINNLIGARRFNPPNGRRAPHDELAEILAEGDHETANPGPSAPQTAQSALQTAANAFQTATPVNQPRNLEVIGQNEQKNVNLEEGLSGDLNNTGRKTQVIPNRVSEEQIVPRGRDNPTGSTRRRRRFRPRSRRRRRGEEPMTPFEIQEERQRQQERTFILNRLRRNFIHELVMVCSLR